MTHSNATAGALHRQLLRGLVDDGVLPSRDTLLARLKCSDVELDRAFESLAEEHGVVLHPGSHGVWVIHPFSLAPTLFLVRSGDRAWWGNCAWWFTRDRGACRLMHDHDHAGRGARADPAQGEGRRTAPHGFRGALSHPHDAGLGQRHRHPQPDAAVPRCCARRRLVLAPPDSEGRRPAGREGHGARGLTRRCSGGR